MAPGCCWSRPRSGRSPPSRPRSGSAGDRPRQSAVVRDRAREADREGGRGARASPVKLRWSAPGKTGPIEALAAGQTDIAAVDIAPFLIAADASAGKPQDVRALAALAPRRHLQHQRRPGWSSAPHADAVRSESRGSSGTPVARDRDIGALGQRGQRADILRLFQPRRRGDQKRRDVDRGDVGLPGGERLDRTGLAGGAPAQLDRRKPARLGSFSISFSCSIHEQRQTGEVDRPHDPDLGRSAAIAPTVVETSSSPAAMTLQ